MISLKGLALNQFVFPSIAGIIYNLGTCNHRFLYLQKIFHHMKSYKVKNSHTDIEPHEVFLDKLAHENEEKLGISEKKFEVPLKETMSYILFGIFFLAAAILFSKVFYFQFFKGKQLSIAAENNKGSANLILPERGIIYDKNMVKLVSNSPAFDLVCNRAHFSVSSPEISNEISDIAASVGDTPENVQNKIAGRFVSGFSCRRYKSR